MGKVSIEGATMYAVPCMAEADLVHGRRQRLYPRGHGVPKLLRPCPYKPGSDIYVLYNYGDFETESGFLSSFIKAPPLIDAKKASDKFRQAGAKVLPALPPQVDVSTVNNPTTKPINGTGSRSGSGNNA